MIEAKIDPEFLQIRYEYVYDSWGQVGGYFDGDGTVYINISSSEVLQFSLVWVDNCREQLGQLRRFLVSQGISTGEVLRRGDGVFTLHIAGPTNVLSAARFLLPHCFKKGLELSLVIDYYENRISGTEAIEGFNSAVRRAIRAGKIRDLQMPKRYAEGKREVEIRRVRSRQLLRSLKKARHVSNITRGGRPPS
jgi:hypothetical protein